MLPNKHSTLVAISKYLLCWTSKRSGARLIVVTQSCFTRMCSSVRSILTTKPLMTSSSPRQHENPHVVFQITQTATPGNTTPGVERIKVLAIVVYGTVLLEHRPWLRRDR